MAIMHWIKGPPKNSYTMHVSPTIALNIEKEQVAQKHSIPEYLNLI